MEIQQTFGKPCEFKIIVSQIPNRGESEILITKDEARDLMQTLKDLFEKGYL